MAVVCANIDERGYGLVVERVLAKDETGVRFSLSAPEKRGVQKRLK